MTCYIFVAILGGQCCTSEMGHCS